MLPHHPLRRTALCAAKILRHGPRLRVPDLLPARSRRLPRGQLHPVPPLVALVPVALGEEPTPRGRPPSDSHRRRLTARWRMRRPEDACHRSLRMAADVLLLHSVASPLFRSRPWVSRLPLPPSVASPFVYSVSKLEVAPMALRARAMPHGEHVCSEIPSSRGRQRTIATCDVLALFSRPAAVEHCIA